jgi:hypothetical protein
MSLKNNNTCQKEWGRWRKNKNDFFSNRTSNPYQENVKNGVETFFRLCNCFSTIFVRSSYLSPFSRCSSLDSSVSFSNAMSGFDLLRWMEAYHVCVVSSLSTSMLPSLMYLRIELLLRSRVLLQDHSAQPGMCVWALNPKPPSHAQSAWRTLDGMLRALWAGKSSCSLCPSGAYASAGEGMLDVKLWCRCLSTIHHRLIGPHPVWADHDTYDCVGDWMGSIHIYPPSIITDADRPPRLQRPRRITVLCALLEPMLQLEVSICSICQEAPEAVRLNVSN